MSCCYHNKLAVDVTVGIVTFVKHRENKQHHCGGNEDDQQGRQCFADDVFHFYNIPHGKYSHYGKKQYQDGK